MNLRFNVDHIVEELGESRKLASPHHIHYLKKMESASLRDLSWNQFIILLKPECFSPSGSGDRAVLDLIWDTLSEHRVEIDAISLMTGKYIRLNAVVENQYRVLNMYARYGAEISPLISYLESGKNFVGAYPFLESYTEFNETSLEQLAHINGCEKIGNGLYSLEVKVKGETLHVLNPFHPFQVSHFQKDDSRLLAMLCSSDRPYHEIAEEVVGFFNPEHASPRSIRNILFRQQRGLGREFSTIYNAIHNSPSPLEALFSSPRYFAKEVESRVHISDMALGKELLKNRDISEDDILNLRFNPYIQTDAESGMLFDLAEGKSSYQILPILNKILKKGSR